ncbi:MAG: tyrosine-type recombinase/integrase [Mycoplasmatota bacterium]
MEIKNESVLFTKYITEYLQNHIYKHKHISSHTAKSHKLSLKLYLEFLEENKVTIKTIKFDSFNYKNLNNWLDWLEKSRDNKPQTINLRLSSIRVFLEFLSYKNIELSYLYNSSFQVKKRKQLKRKIVGMSKNGIKALFNEIDQNTKTGLRDFTLLVLMYNTAARIDEILSIKLSDLYLDCDKPCVSIIGKGNKLRTLFLLPKTVEILRKYMTIFFNETKPDSLLFYSKTKGYSFKLTQPAIDKQIKKWAALANPKCSDVPCSLHAHQLRHAAATHWLEEGINIVQISYLLGHENLETTMVYLEITTEQKAIALSSIDDNENIIKKWNDKTKLSDLLK